MDLNIEGPGPEDDLKRRVIGLFCSSTGQSVVPLELVLAVATDADLRSMLGLCKSTGSAGSRKPEYDGVVPDRTGAGRRWLVPTARGNGTER